VAAVPAPAGPASGGGEPTLRVADPEHALSGVRLVLDLQLAPEQVEFRRAGDWFELALDPPPVWRLEYLLELRYADGAVKIVTDPANPRQAGGACGPKSVLEFAGYVRPGWLSGPAADPGVTTALEAATSIPARIWAPAGVSEDEPLPLLVVHDGPEYDARASLTRYLAVGIARGWLPMLRAALLSPGPRNSWYSASPRYARMLARQVLPALTARLASTAIVGMGTSLGGLAMLHAYCLYPEAFHALFLQSGSFFTPGLDSQERRFPYFRRITQFTAAVHGGGLPANPVPVMMTCGAIEENVANNRLMLAALLARGYPAALREVPDLHNYTAWRDAFDPNLTALLSQAGEGSTECNGT
jgi:enterochelin esterase-like enzyme